MKTVVTGKFAAEKQAARAVDKLLHACIRGDHVRTFFLNPSTPSARPTGERDFDSWRDRQRWTAPANEDSAAIELEVGPAAAADGVEISAYSGRLQGAAGSPPPSRDSAGILVAVETSDHVSQALAVNVLRENGAQGIERAAGAWQAEQQTEFHSISLSSLLEQSDAQGTSGELGGMTRH